MPWRKKNVPHDWRSQGARDAKIALMGECGVVSPSATLWFPFEGYVERGPLTADELLMLRELFYGNSWEVPADDMHLVAWSSFPQRVRVLRVREPRYFHVVLPFRGCLHHLVQVGGHVELTGALIQGHAVNFRETWGDMRLGAEELVADESVLAG